MIVKCSHCQAMLSEGDFDSHKCDIPISGNKIIEVTDFIDVSTKNTKMISAQGIDGVLYAFEVVPRKAIPLMEPLSRRKVTDQQWKDKTDEDVTEPERAVSIVRGGG